MPVILTWSSKVSRMNLLCPVWAWLLTQDFVSRVSRVGWERPLAGLWRSSARLAAGFAEEQNLASSG